MRAFEGPPKGSVSPNRKRLLNFKGKALIKTRAEKSTQKSGWQAHIDKAQINAIAE